MINSPLVIRPAGSGDASRVAGLHVRSWVNAYAPFAPEGWRPPDQDAHRLDYWQPLLERSEPGNRTWLAFWAGIPAGFVTNLPRRDDPPPYEAVPEGLGWLEHIHVAPEFRGRGVGAALFRHALAALAAEGFREAVLWVYEPNALARAFYERFGWRPDGASAERVWRWTGRDGRPGEATMVMVRYRGLTAVE